MHVKTSEDDVLSRTGGGKKVSSASVYRPLRGVNICLRVIYIGNTPSLRDAHYIIQQRDY